jgi:hypothetical protein
MSVGLALVAMAATACAGPNAPFDVGNQAAPINLILGAHDAVVVAPVGPVSVPLPSGLAPYVQPPGDGLPLPSGPPSLPPAVDLGPCPSFDPLAPVIGGTASTLPGPPAPATYVYRAKTTDTIGKATSKFNGNTTWKVTVGAADPTTGAYDVTLDTTVGSAKSSRVLRVQPQAITASTGHDTPLDAPPTLGINEAIDSYNSTVLPYGLPQIPRAAPDVARPGPAGIYLVSQSMGDNTFTPSLPIPILQTPLTNDSYTAFGTDGVTAMTFVSTVKKRVSVNACGSKLDGLEVELSGGHIGTLTPDGKVQELDFTETLDFGLQFGGLPLRDRGTVTGLLLPGGATSPDKIERTFDFTINSRPKPPKA